MVDKKIELTNIVCAENVLDDQHTLEFFSHDQSFITPMKPALVAKVKNVDQVQKIVNWAIQTHTPLVPVSSSGGPRFHGDTIPSSPGAIIIDLSGMKKILHIDPRNRIAITEPGVTYSELQHELAKQGLRVTTSLLPRANKSVVTSLLEREPTLIPRNLWNMLDPLRCLEVVWGDGVRMTTGEAGGMGSLEEEWKLKLAQVSPGGPGQTDFYKLLSAAQGSMGIVTWASVKCEVLPQIYKLFFVPAMKLNSLIDFTYKLLRFRFGDELFILNAWNLASIMGNTARKIKVLSETLPPWVVLVGIAGRDRLPKERVEFQENDITDIARQFGLKLMSGLAGASSDEVLRVILSPSREPCWKLTYKGGCQDIFFLTTLDRTPEFVSTMYSVANVNRYPASEIGVYIQPVHQGASCHCEFNIPFNLDRQKEVTGAKELYVIASKELSKQGAYYSRPYGIWANLAFNHDAQTTKILKQLKEIFDPQNIMNPGKLCF